MRCGEKKSYSKKDAITAMNYRERMGEKKLRIYHCDYCNKWHLTHKEFIKR